MHGRNRTRCRTILTFTTVKLREGFKKKSVVFSTIDLKLLIFFETYSPLLCIFLFTRFGPFGIDEQTEKKCGNVTCSDSRYQTFFFLFLKSSLISTSTKNWTTPTRCSISNSPKTPITGTTGGTLKASSCPNRRSPWPSWETSTCHTGPRRPSSCRTLSAWRPS